MKYIDLIKKTVVKVPETSEECNKTGCGECVYGGELRFNRAFCPHKEVLKTQPEHKVNEKHWRYIHTPNNPDAILQPDQEPKLLHDAKCIQLSNIYNEALSILDEYPCGGPAAVIAHHIYKIINNIDTLDGI